MQDNNKQQSDHSSKPSTDSAVQDHPLSMTVYDLPPPHEVAQTDSNRTLKGRLFMLGVLLICAAPVVLSYFTYYVLRPTSLKSFGELIQPTRPIPSLQGRVIARPKGESANPQINLTQLKGQWLMVSVGEASCKEACQQNLYFQRQIHTALGKERERMDRVWLVTGDGEVAPEILKGLGEAWVIRVSQSELSNWLAPGVGSALNDHLYLVDPMGEWMMRFPAQVGIDTAPKVRRDLERLLRASESWDLPGRSVLPQVSFEQASAQPKPDGSAPMGDPISTPDSAFKSTPVNPSAPKLSEKHK